MLLLNLQATHELLSDVDFNTSYVVIKLKWWTKKTIIFYISIHLMLLLNLHNQSLQRIIKKISIHLMLLLNIKTRRCFIGFLFISIHLMLLLNRWGQYIYLSKSLISIHLMLLLNQQSGTNTSTALGFQYILCCY